MQKKTDKNVRKYRYFKLVTTERRRNYLVSKLNYKTADVYSTAKVNVFHRTFINNKNEKNRNTVYQGFSI